MMKTKILLTVSILLLLLVSACNPENNGFVDEPNLEVVNLQITPTIDHWLPKVADCAEGIPDFSIYTQVLLPSETFNDPADLIIRLGARTDNDPYVVVLGMEKISVIAGSEVPITSLSLESLHNIFSGELTNWAQVPEIMDEGITIDQPIQTLSYPDEHSLRILFERIFLEEKAISSQPMVFSTLERLNQILGEDPYAIGYLLESQAPDNGKILEISGLDPQTTHQLVLAVTPQEPQGQLRQLLLCLQDSP